MELLAIFGGVFALGLALAVFFVIRANRQKRAEALEQERSRQEEETRFINERLLPYYREIIKPLPVSEFSLRVWWYKRIGFMGPWKRFEKTLTIVPAEKHVLTALYYYLRAVDAGDIRERTFVAQAELVVFVQENIISLYEINPG